MPCFFLGALGPPPMPWRRHRQRSGSGIRRLEGVARRRTVPSSPHQRKPRSSTCGRRSAPAPAPHRPGAGAWASRAVCARVARAAKRLRASTHLHAVFEHAGPEGAATLVNGCDGFADCGAAIAPTVPRHIQPLAGRRKQALGARQHPRQLRQMTAAVFHAFAETTQRPALEIQHLRQQFSPHRHRQFGGGGGGWRTDIGGEIDQGGVGLMPHRRNQRNKTGGGGAPPPRH